MFQKIIKILLREKYFLKLVFRRMAFILLKIINNHNLTVTYVRKSFFRKYLEMFFLKIFIFSLFVATISLVKLTVSVVRYFFKTTIEFLILEILILRKNFNLRHAPTQIYNVTTIRVNFVVKARQKNVAIKRQQFQNLFIFFLKKSYFGLSLEWPRQKNFVLLVVLYELSIRNKLFFLTYQIFYPAKCDNLCNNRKI